MKLIYNIVIIPVFEGRYLLVNTLNGLIDEIDNNSYNTLQSWKLDECIKPVGKTENDLFNSLLERGYLVTNEAEENELKNNIYMKLKETSKRAKDNRENITFIITYKCNFKCPYCYEVNNSQKIDIITKEMIDIAFSMTQEKLKNIGLFGGEPLLLSNRDIIEYIVYKRKNLNYHVITNGYHIIDYYDLFQKIKIDFIQVTLDGEKKTHDSRRFLINGGPTFDRIITGITKCLENKINVRIRMNIDKDNYTECVNLRQTLKDSLPNTNDYLSFEIQPIFQLEDIENRTNLLEYLYLLDADNSKEEIIKNNRILTSFKPIIKYFMCKEKIRPIYNFCSAHNNSLMFDPLGDIYPCLVAVGKNKYSVGTYYPEVKIKEKSIFTRNIETIKECRQCKYAFLCGGGCPVGLTDEAELYKPNCHTTLYDIYKLIPVMYKTGQLKVFDNSR